MASNKEGVLHDDSGFPFLLKMISGYTDFKFSLNKSENTPLAVFMMLSLSVSFMISVEIGELNLTQPKGVISSTMLVSTTPKKMPCKCCYKEK